MILFLIFVFGCLGFASLISGVREREGYMIGGGFVILFLDSLALILYLGEILNAPL